MATTAINKDGTPRKQRNPESGPRKQRNHVRVTSITIDANKPIGAQLKPYRLAMNLSCKAAAELMDWPNGGSNLWHLEASTGPFKGNGAMHINSTHLAYMKALGIKKVTLVF